MPRTGVSYDDVANSIHHLEKAGLNPSIRLIREKLGKGSLTTIAEHKRAFEAERAEGPGKALPDPITRGLIAGAQRHWQELVDAAQAEIDAVQETAKAEHQALETQLEEVARKNARLHDELGAKTAAIGELEANQRDQVAQLQAQAGAAQKLEVKLARLTADNEALSARSAELKDDLARAHDALAQSEAERARLAERLESQAAEFAKDRAAFKTQAQSDQSKMAALVDEARQAKAARLDAEKALSEESHRAADAARESTRLAQALADSEDQARALTEQLGELRGRLAATDEQRDRDKQAFERLLAENAEHVASLKSALEDARRLTQRSSRTGNDRTKARRKKAKNDDSGS